MGSFNMQFSYMTVSTDIFVCRKKIRSQFKMAAALKSMQASKNSFYFIMMCMCMWFVNLLVNMKSFSSHEQI